eukprot:5220729-Pleurochrysis_carterae.AAC.1
MKRGCTRDGMLIDHQTKRIGPRRPAPARNMPETRRSGAAKVVAPGMHARACRKSDTSSISSVSTTSVRGDTCLTAKGTIAWPMTDTTAIVM